MTNLPKKVKITYKVVDGLHFFAAGDRAAAGLCVANTDLDAAYAEVGEQLQKIFAFNFGKKSKFSPMVPLNLFKKMIKAYGAINDLNESNEVENSTTQPWVILSTKSHQKEIA